MTIEHKKKKKHVRLEKMKLKDANERVLAPLNQEDQQQRFIEMLREAGQNLRTPEYRVENGVIVIN